MNSCFTACACKVGRPRTSTKDLRDRTGSDSKSSRAGSKLAGEVEYRVKEAVEANGNIAVNLSNGQVQLLQELEFLPGNMDTPQAGHDGFSVVRGCFLTLYQAGFLAGAEAVKPILDDLAELALLASETFLVEAHCRKKGTEFSCIASQHALNVPRLHTCVQRFWQTLADNRSRLVANELMARGVPEEKLQIRGTPGKHGKRWRPDSHSGSRCVKRAISRRVDVLLACLDAVSYEPHAMPCEIDLLTLVSRILTQVAYGTMKTCLACAFNNGLRLRGLLASAKVLSRWMMHSSERVRTGLILSRSRWNSISSAGLKPTAVTTGCHACRGGGEVIEGYLLACCVEGAWLNSW
eukprot:938124-Amphidinium_carterae.2